MKNLFLFLLLSNASPQNGYKKVVEDYCDRDCAIEDHAELTVVAQARKHCEKYTPIVIEGKKYWITDVECFHKFNRDMEKKYGITLQ